MNALRFRSFAYYPRPKAVFCCSLLIKQIIAQQSADLSAEASRPTKLYAKSDGEGGSLSEGGSCLKALTENRQNAKLFLRKPRRKPVKVGKQGCISLQVCFLRTLATANFKLFRCEASGSWPFGLRMLPRPGCTKYMFISRHRSMPGADDGRKLCAIWRSSRLSH